jgi:hypothetical protein
MKVYIRYSVLNQYTATSTYYMNKINRILKNSDCETKEKLRDLFYDTVFHVVIIKLTVRRT